MKNVVFLSLFFLLFCLSCTQDNKTPEKEEKEKDKKEKDIITKKQPVHVDEVKKGSISSYLLSSGTIASHKLVEIFPKVSGYVISIMGKEGSLVKKGMPLLKLDPREWEIAVTQAKMEILELKQRKKQEKLNIENLKKKIEQANLNTVELQEQMKQVKLDQDKAKKDLQRSEESYRKNIISEGDLENNRYNYQKSLLAENSLIIQIKKAIVTKDEAFLDWKRAGIELQNLKISILRVEKATLRDAQLKLSYATIVAPFNGVLIEKEVTEGQLIGTSAKVFSLISLNKLILLLNIPERELPLLKIKQKVLLKSENFPNFSGFGFVTFISPIVNNETGTVAVKVVIKGKHPVLRPGVFLQASIIIQNKLSVITISRAPILYDNNKTYVFIVNESNKTEKRIVETGIREGDMIEIISGISEGEKLIVGGHHVIEADQEVEIIARDNLDTP